VSPTELENMNHSIETSKGSLENETLKQKSQKAKGLVLMVGRITSWLREIEERNSLRPSLLLQLLFLTLKRYDM